VRQVPVSVVVPAYNEARRLPSSLPALVAALSEYPGAEVIVVDDGSVDDTAVIARRLLSDLPNSSVIRLPWNGGKGAAVRVGVAAATGAAIVFTDADLASDVGDLPLLLAALADAEIAIGSRRVGAGASRPYVRQLGSWAFNQLTRSFTAIELADTQCGFKAFRHAEAKILFGLSRASGFGFDVEVLAMAQAMGYRIVEVPVRWSEEPGGTFRVVRHTPSMLVELARARRYVQRASGPLRTAAGSPAVGQAAAAAGSRGAGSSGAGSAGPETSTSVRPDAPSGPGRSATGPAELGGAEPGPVTASPAAGGSAAGGSAPSSASGEKILADEGEARAATAGRPEPVTATVDALPPGRAPARPASFGARIPRAGQSAVDGTGGPGPSPRADSPV
jgi:hypothetical protein